MIYSERNKRLLVDGNATPFSPADIQNLVAQADALIPLICPLPSWLSQHCDHNLKDAEALADAIVCGNDHSVDVALAMSSDDDIEEIMRGIPM